MRMQEHRRKAALVAGCEFTVEFSSSPHFFTKGKRSFYSLFRKKIACGAPRKATFASSPYGVGAAQPACQTPPSASTPVTPEWGVATPGFQQRHRNLREKLV